MQTVHLLLHCTAGIAGIPCNENMSCGKLVQCRKVLNMTHASALCLLPDKKLCFESGTHGLLFLVTVVQVFLAGGFGIDNLGCVYFRCDNIYIQGKLNKTYILLTLNSAQYE